MRIIIAPLDWGLGHASRCIPLIQLLLQQDNEIIIASSGAALDLLKKQFPQLEYLELPSYQIRYPYRNALINFLSYAPRLIRAVFLEKRTVRLYLKNTTVDYIISDNRLGFSFIAVPKIYITHQLNFAFSNRILNLLAARMHYWWYKKFDEIWIPDLPLPHSLAGKLSQASFPGKYRHLGLLSQFEKEEATIKYESISILSGPEPQRTYLEKALLIQLKNIPGPHLLVQGLPQQKDSSFEEGAVKVHSFLGKKDLAAAIAKSKLVVCRSGYSSLMDLFHFGKKALLIPTPGQPEQLYLAEYHRDKAYFEVQTQEQLDLKSAFMALSAVENKASHRANHELKSAVSSLISH